MWFAAKTETVEIQPPEPTPQERYEQNRTELRALGQELTAAERAIKEHGKDRRVLFIYGNGQLTMRTRINAMNMAPTLRKLESHCSEIRRQRAAKLVEHARLKKECGLGNF
jgi:hypothetical protein